MKAQHPGLKVLISLGGWTWSKWFSEGALTPESRAAFVAPCVDLFIKDNLPDPGWGGMGGPGAIRSPGRRSLMAARCNWRQLRADSH